MDDDAMLRALYERLYAGMLEKDRDVILSCFSDDASMIHMTGLVQSPESFVSSVLDGTLNYYEVVTERLDIRLKNDHAEIVGFSKVTAAVYGGGRHEWRLRMDSKALKIGDEWKIKESRASTYRGD